MRLAITALAVCLGAGSAFAAELTCSQVKLVVPYSAAGATDVASRILAERLEGALKRPYSSRIGRARPAISAPAPWSQPNRTVARFLSTPQ